MYLKWEHTRILVLVVFMLKSTRLPGHFLTTLANLTSLTVFAPHQAKHHTTNPSKYPPVRDDGTETCHPMKVKKVCYGWQG